MSIGVYFQFLPNKREQLVNNNMVSKIYESDILVPTLSKKKTKQTNNKNKTTTTPSPCAIYWRKESCKYGHKVQACGQIHNHTLHLITLT